MFFRILKIIIFFVIVAIFEIVAIYLYRPSLMIDAYRGDDETNIWITTRYFDFQRKISDRIKLVKEDVLPYDFLLDSLSGWVGYAIWANTYKLRKKLA